MFPGEQVSIRQADQLRGILSAVHFGQSPANRHEAAIEVLKIDVTWEILHQGSQQTALFGQGEFRLASLGMSQATPTI